jgi:excisionase family DNA binding protein
VTPDNAIDALADAVLDRVREKLPDLMPVTRRLMTCEEAAEYLGCTTKHVRSLEREGRFTPVEWSTGRYARPYYDVRDLDAAIEKAKRKGTE